MVPLITDDSLKLFLEQNLFLAALMTDVGATVFILLVRYFALSRWRWCDISALIL